MGVLVSERVKERKEMFEKKTPDVINAITALFFKEEKKITFRIKNLCLLFPLVPDKNTV